MVACRWPLSGKIEYGSLDPDSEDDLESEQRAAKRRRIEKHANDYLRGKEIYISCAILRGTFDSTCLNPWRSKRRQVDLPDSDHGEDGVEEEHGTVRKQSEHQGLDAEGGRYGYNLNGRTKNGQVLEPVARPMTADTWENSRAYISTSRAGTGYCADWLQRQNAHSQTPTVDSDDETSGLCQRVPVTVSKSPTQRALSRKLVRDSRLNLSRQSTASRTEPPSHIRPPSPSIEHHRTRFTTIDHDLSIISNLPESKKATAGSINLQHRNLENKTIAAKRREQAAMPPPRLSTFTAINSASKGGPLSTGDCTSKEPGHGLGKGVGRRSRDGDLNIAEGHVCQLDQRDSKHPLVASPAVANGSPGFPYRRALDNRSGIVPISRASMAYAQAHVQSRVMGSEVKKSKVTESKVADIGNDSVLGNDDPIEDIELDTAPNQLRKMDADAIQSLTDSEDPNAKEVRIVEPSAEDIQTAGVMAKWRCPVEKCIRDFSTRKGLASHITRGHKLQVADEGPLGKPKRKGTSKSTNPVARALKRRKVVEDNIDECGSVYEPSRNKTAASTNRQASRPSPTPQQRESDHEMSDVGDGADLDPILDVETNLSPKGAANTEVSLQGAETNELEHAVSGITESDEIVTGSTEYKLIVSYVEQSEGSGEKSAEESTTIQEKPIAIESGPTIPDHQDSRAYSTFTFNPEQSTQAALLQAQLAFQETQVDNHDQDADALNAGPTAPKPVTFASISNSAHSLGAVTPFRELNNRCPALAVPTPVFPVLPASTQDLEAEATGVIFSTVKKPRTGKRTSFENWPTTKPSKGSVAKPSTKSVEWSPFANETPMPKDQFAASRTSLFDTNGGEDTEIGRNESFSTEEEAQITVLEAAGASSSFVKRSFPVPTPQIRPGSFSARLIPMSSALSARSRDDESASAPSDVPVPSFQEGQGLLAELNSQDVDGIMDEANFFLGSLDFGF